jgi:hypothetical protein
MIFFLLQNLLMYGVFIYFEIIHVIVLPIDCEIPVKSANFDEIFLFNVFIGFFFEIFYSLFYFFK